MDGSETDGMRLGGETEFERAYHGLVADYFAGVIDGDQLQTGLDTLFDPGVARALGAAGVFSGDVMPE